MLAMSHTNSTERIICHSEKREEFTRWSEWIDAAASTSIALPVAASVARRLWHPQRDSTLMQFEGLNWTLLTEIAMLHMRNIVSSSSRFVRHIIGQNDSRGGRRSGQVRRAVHPQVGGRFLDRLPR